MEVWVTPIVSVLSIAVTYVFGRLQAKQSSKTTVLQNRYDKFYAPFVRAIYVLKLWELPFSQAPINPQKEIIAMICSNLSLIHEEAIAIFPELYQSYIEYRKDPELTHELNASFDSFTLSILAESTRLAKKLHIPNLAEYASTMYGSK